MIGFEAISHHNGWAAAATGASIVFIGLATLSLIISQLHKIIALLDQPKKSKIQVVVDDKPKVKPQPECPLNLDLTICRFEPLINELDPEFDLADLYVLAKQYHLPHPHLSIRCLLESGALQPLGNGIFRLSKPEVDHQ